jgi:hypothetical protein
MPLLKLAVTLMRGAIGSLNSYQQKQIGEKRDKKLSIS